MNIVADESILMLDVLFRPMGHLITRPGRQIVRSDLAHADMLLVRSVTPVNSELLANTSVQFVGSATAGFDHLDFSTLNKMGVRMAHAPGCNAWAVVDYVLSAFFSLVQKYDRNWQQMTMGIVGCGQIGKRLALACQTLGMSVIAHDPLSIPSDRIPFLSLDDVLENSDVVSLHVPLTSHGRYATRHMIGESQLQQMKPGAMLINTSRGAVVDNRMLNHWLQQKKNLKVVLDVWENEPGISPDLLQFVDIGTPHIAGYSREGRIRGVLAICRATREYWKESLPEQCKKQITQGLEQGAKMLINQDDGEPVVLAKSGALYLVNLLQQYDVRQDSKALKAAINKKSGEKEHRDAFDRLRKNYSYRREYMSCLFQ